jgi:hypothetical protein
MDLLVTVLIIGAWFFIGWNARGMYDLKKFKKSKY